MIAVKITQPTCDNIRKLTSSVSVVTPSSSFKFELALRNSLINKVLKYYSSIVPVNNNKKIIIIYTYCIYTIYKRNGPHTGITVTNKPRGAA